MDVAIVERQDEIGVVGEGGFWGRKVGGCAKGAGARADAIAVWGAADSALNSPIKFILADGPVRIATGKEVRWTRDVVTYERLKALNGYSRLRGVQIFLKVFEGNEAPLYH